ncbi:S-adenosyl-L-methionine-dependent methyltransferase [Flammula alnicola]|nr:S-adenosyl-L-methionine-dependent methyltransferase [Flammula alnicola]
MQNTLETSGAPSDEVESPSSAPRKRSQATKITSDPVEDQLPTSAARRGRPKSLKASSEPIEELPMSSLRRPGRPKSTKASPESADSLPPTRRRRSKAGEPSSDPAEAASPPTRRRRSKTVEASASSEPSEDSPSPSPSRRVRKRAEGAAPSTTTKAKKDIEPLTHTSTLELPPIDEWRKYFALTRESAHRASVRNPETARMLAEAFVPEGSKDKIIIEASPGPGQLTRALLNLPKERIKKLIVIEDVANYVPFLKSLEDIDPRVKVYQKMGKQWTTYNDIEEDGALDDVKTMEWDKVHDQLQFIMHMASDTQGEQLVAQLLRAVPDRQWLFKYGRVPLSLVLSARMWERVNAPPSHLARCKVSAMAQAVATFSPSVPYEKLQPYADHFHPARLSQTKETDRYRSPHVAITITPLQHPVIKSGDLDYWDFCLRKLFVQKATPLERCISGLGPGAYNILPKLTDPSLPKEDVIDIKKMPREFNIHEWDTIVRTFKEWPFRPQDLGIEVFTNRVEKHR